jgi:hypothetical protein
MLALRTAPGMPLSWMAGGAGVATDLERDGLARIESGRLLLTDRGFLMVNDIVLRVVGRTC